MAEPIKSVIEPGIAEMVVAFFAGLGAIVGALVLSRSKYYESLLKRLAEVENRNDALRKEVDQTRKELLSCLSHSADQANQLFYSEEERHRLVRLCVEAGVIVRAPEHWRANNKELQQASE